jgi:hypothetical protein
MVERASYLHYLYSSWLKKVFLMGGAAMTGWRLGFAAAPKDLLQAMLKIHHIR